VMYLGKLVETASSADIYHNPLHPYTKALYAAALPSHPDQQKEKITVTGEVPSPLNPPEGCRFHPRCPEAFPRCTQEEPKLIDMGNDQQVSCHLYDK